VEAVLQRALAVDPHDRYPDAGSFWAALRDAVADAPSATPLPDVSETGDFVSRNAIDLEPDALSKIDRQLDAVAAKSAAGGAVRSKAGSNAQRLDSDGVTAVRGQESSAAPSARPAEAERASAPTPAKSAGSAAAPRSEGGGAKPVARAQSANEVENRTTRFGDTLQPESGADRRIAWWMPLVAVAALAGAGLLYIELEREGFGGPDPTATGNSGQGTRSRPTLSGKPPPGTRPDGGATAASLDGGSDAGDPADAAVDGSTDGGDGGDARHSPPPEGMVYVPPADPQPDGPPGFFIDRTEVTTGAYRDCVRAGRCVQANRVVLSAELADRIWGKPDAGSAEPTESPEQLARAWGKRCNEVRSAIDHPINCVNHASAEDYCRFAGKRLPTSAEWSFAHGVGQRYPWGETRPTCGLACFGLNGSCVTASTEVATCPVGSHGRDRSPPGVLDLAANVAEWVADEVAPPSPHLPSLRMVRGGSFTDEADDIGERASQTVPPVTAYVSIGFRCAKDAPAGYSPPPP
jgi:serine/threonine-protein kinase